MFHNENQMTPRTDPKGYSFSNTGTQGATWPNPYNQGGWNYNPMGMNYPTNVHFHPGMPMGPGMHGLSRPAFSPNPGEAHCQLCGYAHGNDMWHPHMASGNMNPWYMPTSQPSQPHFGNQWGWQGNAEGVERANVFCPPVCVTENNQCFCISCELPGVSEKDIDLLVQNGVVTIRGQKKRRPIENDCEVCVNDQVCGQFHRTIYLSEIADCIDTNKISTKWNNGTLEITLPKNKQSTGSYIKVGPNK